MLAPRREGCAGPGSGAAPVPACDEDSARWTLALHVAASPASAAPERRPAAPANQAEGSTDDLFVGRGDELASIAAAAARHAGGVVLITGEGGAGKSRLLDRAARRLAGSAGRW